MSPKLEQLVFVLFSKHLQAVDIEALWNNSGVAPGSDWTIEKRSGPQPARRLRGIFEERYGFVFGIAGDRAELRIFPAVYPDLENQQPPLVNHFPDATDASAWIKSASSALLKQLPPTVHRIALHTMWFWDFEDKKLCAEYTKSRVPINFERLGYVDDSMAEDLVLQYNRPKSVSGLTFNRIVSWQTLRANSAFLAADSAKLLQRSVDFWMLRCALDVNSAVTSDGTSAIDLQSDGPESILESVFQIANELINEQA